MHVYFRLVPKTTKNENVCALFERADNFPDKQHGKIKTKKHTLAQNIKNIISASWDQSGNIWP